MKKLLNATLRRFGLRLVRTTHPAVARQDIQSQEFQEVKSSCDPYTLTTTERLYALWKAVHHLERRSIAGALVECGVWRGGSAMLCAYTLKRMSSADREIYLYDTFQGMPRPTDRDVRFDGEEAVDRWESKREKRGSRWHRAPLEDVKANLARTGYPADRIRYVKGKVEDTIPGTIPDRIALLRLDTDFFESTAHELEHLYPRLVEGGILIVDDYGHWRGAREAVDRYFRNRAEPIFLSRVDYSCRVGVKS